MIRTVRSTKCSQWLLSVLTVCGVLLAAPPVPGDTPNPSELVTVSGYVDSETIDPSKPFQLLFHFKMKPEWHIYWKNPGDAGLETTISVDAPDGFSVEDIRWPRPIRFETSGMTSYGYTDETVLFVPVTPPSSLPDPPYRFTARVEYLACKEKCVQGGTDVTISVPEDHTKNASLQKTIRKHEAAIPKPFEKQNDHSIQQTKNEIVLKGPTPNEDRIQFFPVHVPGVDLGDPSVETTNEGRFRVSLPVSVSKNNRTDKQPLYVKGVIAFGHGLTDPSYEITVPLNDGE